jgi:hypothetical protein
MNTKNKKTMTFDGGNPDPGLGYAHKMSKVYDTCYLIGFELSIFSISFIEKNICIIFPSLAKR